MTKSLDTPALQALAVQTKSIKPFLIILEVSGILLLYFHFSVAISTELPTYETEDNRRIQLHDTDVETAVHMTAQSLKKKKKEA